MSNEYAIAQYERETDPMNSPRRPWILRTRVITSKGTWTSWHTHATYTSEQRAEVAAAILKEEWAKRDIPCETHIQKRATP